MNEPNVDQRIGAILRGVQAAPDSTFADRIICAARIDAEIRYAQRHAWRRAAIECAAAVAIAWSFYLLSQAQPAPTDGTISLYGTTMAGMVMLALWVAVALPRSGESGHWPAGSCEYG